MSNTHLIDSKRRHLIDLLQKYNPVLEEEIIYKTKTIAFIKAHKNCFERSLKIGHITASAWLLNKDGSKALLMHHAKLKQWVQLGGHADGNPNVLNVAIKEAQEESGISSIHPVSDEIFDLDIHLIPETTKDKAHFHYDIRFLLQVTGNEEAQKNHESNELRWIDKDSQNLPTTEPSVVRMFNKWR